MANELGLKNSLRERLLRPFWNYRNPNDVGKAGLPITFETFMQTRPDGGEILKSPKTNEPLSWPDLFNEMGESPYNIFLNSLAARDDDFQYLFGPIIEDAFIKGFIQQTDNRPPLWSQICYATGVPTPRDYVARTFLKFTGAPTETAEGENFPEATIQIGEESIIWGKKGLTLRLTQEYLRANPLPIVEDWIAEIGRIYQYKENNACIRTLVDGDLQNNANAAPVIGVTDPTKGLQYEDLVNVWNQGDYIGEKWFTAVSSRPTGNKLSLMPEFKQRYLGTPLIKLVNSPEPSEMTRYINEEVTDGQVLLIDDSHAVRQRVFIPINVRQSEKPENWTKGVTIGYSSTFERVGDKACLIMDESLAFADYGFPTWFVIGGVRPF